MRFDEVDTGLLRRTARGDAAAFEELCAAIQPDLYAFIHSHLRNHEDTDEVLLECLVRIHRHLHTLADLGRFPWWLMRMAVNQCNSHRVRAAHHASVPLDDAVGVEPDRLVASAAPPASPREHAERGDTRRCVNEAIAMLPPRQRSAIILFELEDRPIAEIAEILECSEGAVKFNLHEGRKKLRELLKPMLSAQPARAPSSEVAP